MTKRKITLGMEVKDRDAIRRLQDKVIKYLEKSGYKNDDIIPGMLNYNKTRVKLSDLKKYIFPEYVDQFKAALRAHQHGNW
jgi:hypothetical protein